MSHTWLYNPATDAHWQCPDGMVHDLVAGGWERCDPPAVRNPVTAEHAEWRQAQAVEDQRLAANPKTTKAAARGESQEG